MKGEAGKFLVYETKKREFEKVGRAILSGEEVLLILDGIGRYLVPAGEIRAIMAFGGTAAVSGNPGGTCWRSESGRGFYFTAGEGMYVIPRRSLEILLAGKGKAPVFEKTTRSTDGILVRHEESQQ